MNLLINKKQKNQNNLLVNDNSKTFKKLKEYGQKKFEEKIAKLDIFLKSLIIFCNL